jgi:hypothetical protein
VHFAVAAWFLFPAGCRHLEAIRWPDRDGIGRSFSISTGARPVLLRRMADRFKKSRMHDANIDVTDDAVTHRGWLSAEFCVFD